MGLLDHRKQWTFEVNATPESCIQAFSAAFAKGGGPKLMKAKWAITTQPGQNGLPVAVARYKGRAGIVGGLSGLSAMATSEQQGAEDSSVSFAVESNEGGKSTCSMWLGEYGSRMGLTADARFIRPYMQAVETSLRKVDPRLTAQKG
jgi:hypothetical protein